MKPDILFVLSIDTEEEWNWSGKFPSTDCAVSNADSLPSFQAFCDDLGIRPTYFVDYAVANAPKARNVVEQLASLNSVEIGAHLHPWCNPPFFGETDERRSHIVNLPECEVEPKLAKLTALLHEISGYSPLSFRSGRWGINSSCFKLLAKYGYRVDSSVYPFYQNEFFSCEGSPLSPYWPNFNSPLEVGDQRQIVEIPVTAGFNRKNYKRASSLHNALSSPNMAWSKLVGVLWHTQLLRKIYLSPELTDSEDMKKLVDTALVNGQTVIHMFFHSSSLIDHATGLMNVNGAFNKICNRIRILVAHLESVANVKHYTISEAASVLQTSTTPVLHLQSPQKMQMA